MDGGKLMTCYTEKETLFLLDCIDFVIDNDVEYEEYTLVNSEQSLEPLRAKVLNNLLKLQEAV